LIAPAPWRRGAPNAKLPRPDRDASEVPGRPGDGNQETLAAMSRPTGKESEQAIEAVLAALNFDGDGLLAAIAQQFDTGEVLMLAWMNREAVAATLRSGEAHYWSRARGRLWRKGETSGQTQRLVELRLDCDRDALLLQVDQTGVACHTGRRSCFFTALRRGKLETVAEVQVDPSRLYGE
jgi:phosphoribosyl-AMP cyclohydrolase